MSQKRAEQAARGSAVGIGPLCCLAGRWAVLCSDFSMTLNTQRAGPPLISLLPSFSANPESPLHPSPLPTLEDWDRGSQNCQPKATPSAGPRRRCGAEPAASTRAGTLGKAESLDSPRGAFPLMQSAPRRAASQHLSKQMPRGALDGPWNPSAAHTLPLLGCRRIASRPGRAAGACAESPGRSGAWGSHLSAWTPDGMWF